MDATTTQRSSCPTDEAEPPIDARMPVLERTAQHFMTHSADPVKRRKLDLSNKVGEAGGASQKTEEAIFSLEPLSNLFRSRWILFLLAVECSILSTELGYATRSPSRASFSSLRFVPLKVEPALDPNMTLDIHPFSLLRDGCLVHESGTSILLNSTPAVAYRFGVPHFNGWAVYRRGYSPARGTDSNKITTGNLLAMPPLENRTEAISISHEEEGLELLSETPARPFSGDGIAAVDPSGKNTADLERETVAFRLDALRDDQEWVPVVSSTWKFNQFLQPVLLHGQRVPNRDAPHGYYELDMRPPLGLWLFRVLGRALRLAALMLSGGLVVIGRGLQGQKMGLASFLVPGITALVAAGLLGGNHPALPYAWLAPALHGAFDLLMFYYMAPAGIGGVLLVCLAVVDGQSPASQPESILAELPFSMMLAVVLGIAGVVHQGRALAAAKHIIAADLARYNEVWEVIRQLEVPEAFLELHRMLLLIEDIACINHRPRHLQLRQFIFTMTTGADGKTRERRIWQRRSVDEGATDSGEANPLVQPLDAKLVEVNDLDQVFHQARALDPLFRHKVWQWARSAKAMLPTKLESNAGAAGSGSNCSPESQPRVDGVPIRVDSGDVLGGGNTSVHSHLSPLTALKREASGCAHSSEAAHEQSSGAEMWTDAEKMTCMEEVSWAPLKGVDRAIAKVSRVYGNEASQLTDVCRQRIVVRSVEDMLRCVEVIAGDSDILLRGVKNRMTSADALDKSAGFRAVTLNLSLATAAASPLWLHVCELQIVLLPIAQVQASANHGSYLMFRDVRDKSLINSLRKNLFSGSSAHSKDFVAALERMAAEATPGSQAPFAKSLSRIPLDRLHLHLGGSAGAAKHGGGSSWYRDWKIRTGQRPLLRSATSSPRARPGPPASPMHWQQCAGLLLPSSNSTTGSQAARSFSTRWLGPSSRKSFSSDAGSAGALSRNRSSSSQFDSFELTGSPGLEEGPSEYGSSADAQLEEKLRELILCQHRRSRAFSTLQEAFSAKILAAQRTRSGPPPSAGSAPRLAPGPLHQRRKSLHAALPDLSVDVGSRRALGSPLITATRAVPVRRLQPPPPMPLPALGGQQDDSEAEAACSPQASLSLSQGGVPMMAARNVMAQRRAGRRDSAKLSAPFQVGADSEQARRVGAGGSDDLEEALERVFLLAMTNPGGVLDAKVKESSRQAMKDVNLASGFFSSMPLACTVGFTSVQICMAAIALLYVLGAVYPIVRFANQGIRLVSSLKVEAFDATGATALGVAGEWEASLLWNGCANWRVGIRTPELHGPDLVVRWEKESMMNGWSVRTAPRSDVAALAVWGLSGGASDDQQWECLLPHHLQQEAAGECRVHVNSTSLVHHTTVTARLSGDQEQSGAAGGDDAESLFEMDLRPTIANVLWVGVLLAHGLEFALAAACGYARQERLAVWTLVLCQGVSGLLLICAAVGVQVGEGDSVRTWWGLHGALLLLAAMALVFPRQRHRAVLARGTVSLVNVLLIRWCYCDEMRCQWDFWTSVSVFGDMAVLCACVALFWTRTWVRWRSAQLLEQDKSMYDREWDKIVQSEAAEASLLRLRETVRNIKGPVEGGLEQPRQRLTAASAEDGTHSSPQSAQSSSSTSSIVDLIGAGQMRLAVRRATSSVEEADIYPPLRSLDQIFFQAEALHMVLVEAVQRWATLPVAQGNGGTGGMVMLQNGTFVPWKHVRDDPCARAKVKWARVKKSQRAIEKQLRIYAGDASRLVDICRQTLAFNSVADLEACLCAINADPVCRILRIKNRLDPSYNSALSAGYRDVAINLQLITPVTTAYALQKHVCELQLILLPFATLKSEQGHTRYVRFRNARAE